MVPEPPQKIVKQLLLLHNICNIIGEKNVTFSLSISESKGPWQELMILQF